MISLLTEKDSHARSAPVAGIQQLYSMKSKINKLCRMKVLLCHIHLNSHTLRFHPQTMIFLLSVLTFSYHYRIQKLVTILMIMMMTLGQEIQILITGKSIFHVPFSSLCSCFPLPQNTLSYGLKQPPCHALLPNKNISLQVQRASSA